MTIKNHNMDILKWIQHWYAKHCDGDWEHDNGIVIETLDNPGWRVLIDLAGTDVRADDEKWQWHETSEADWYGYKIENNTFDASGDPSKLEFLLQLFKEKVVGN